MPASGIAPAGTAAELIGQATEGGAAPEALASLYSAPHRRRARAKTAKALVGGGERPQQIYTPQTIIDAILRVWPHIALDPCSGPDSIVPAACRCYVSEKPDGKFTPGPGEIDGTKLPWVDHTYANPPFRFLKQWLGKARTEGAVCEVMMLAPVRPHRVWWREARESAAATAWLNPVIFRDYKSGFPVPMALLYWGELVEVFTWSIESAGLGDVEPGSRFRLY